jgi:hypothetical protein
MSLKLKARIYRYTGIYLAKREEAMLPTTAEYWKMYTSYSLDNQDLHHIAKHGYIVGSWHAQHGFVRYDVQSSLYRKGFRKPAALRKAIAWIVELTYAIWDDLKGGLRGR